MPELRGDHPRQAHVGWSPQEAAPRPAAQTFPGAAYGSGVEVTSFPERLLAEQLVQREPAMRRAERVIGRTKHLLAAPGDRARQPTLRQAPQHVFLAPAA